MKYLIHFLLFLLLNSCSKKEIEIVIDPVEIRNMMVDKNATDETMALFYNLKTFAKTNFAIGQQDAFNHFYQNISGPSDIKKNTGKDVAMIGLDFSFINDDLNTGQPENWFYQQEIKIRQDAIKAYDQGGFVTFCWHFREPYKGLDFYTDKMDDFTKQNAFKSILPGGENHEYYKKKLDKIADFTTNLHGSDGKQIPIIFRPFHEFDGSWFWWGADYCTSAEYKSMYTFTVEYLRDTKGVHNIIYAFSPDNRFFTIPDYLYRYPGDSYVDVLGMDNYGDFDNQGDAGVERANNKLKIISDLARQRNKIAALTETGYQITESRAPQIQFFSSKIYKALTNQNIEIAYVQFWGNSEKAYFVPAANLPDSQDFIDFINQPRAALLDDLTDIYRINK
ncbi:MAG: beta-mannosidase [Saprospiraceae bacterium]|nr:beta-mannosidase [Candidatus Brachybacter algidus]